MLAELFPLGLLICIERLWFDQLFAHEDVQEVGLVDGKLIEGLSNLDFIVGVEECRHCCEGISFLRVYLAGFEENVHELLEVRVFGLVGDQTNYAQNGGLRDVEQFFYVCEQHSPEQLAYLAFLQEVAQFERKEHFELRNEL